MKSLVLSTSTNETTKYSEHLRNLKFGPVELMSYDQLGHSEPLMMAKAKEHAPDFVVYIGTRWGMQPSFAALSRINSSIAPMVHICSDAADPPWWSLLQEYHYAGCFSLQVAIDGSRKWPISDSQMTELTPVDPATFPAFRPHAERPVIFGYAGNAGSGNGSKRTGMLEALLSMEPKGKMLDVRVRSNLAHTYEFYCEYLSKCRMSLNIAWSGTEATTQVKGRVIESGLAGCCLLETKGAPTSDWFVPGRDYLEYGDQFEAEQIVRRLESEPEATQAIGESLRTKILNNHTPEKFWGRIFERIGLKVVA